MEYERLDWEEPDEWDNHLRWFDTEEINYHAAYNDLEIPEEAWASVDNMFREFHKEDKRNKTTWVPYLTKKRIEFILGKHKEEVLDKLFDQGLMQRHKKWYSKECKIFEWKEDHPQTLYTPYFFGILEFSEDSGYDGDYMELFDPPELTEAELGQKFFPFANPEIHETWKALQFRLGKTI